MPRPKLRREHSGKKRGRPIGNRKGHHRHSRIAFIENQRKIAWALELRDLHQMSWTEIAASMWPLDDEGKPKEGSRPMWTTPQAAQKAVADFAKRIDDDLREEAFKAILRRAARRHAYIASYVSQGSIVHMQEARAIDDQIARLLGLYRNPLTPPMGNGDGGTPTFGMPQVGAIAAVVIQLVDHEGKEVRVIEHEPATAPASSNGHDPSHGGNGAA